MACLLPADRVAQVNPYYADESATVYAGDCLEVLAGLADSSVDAVCTDPPSARRWKQPSSRGFRAIGIEREPDYLPLIRARLVKPLQVSMW